MSDFRVLVRKITKPVINHPNADRLTIVTLDGYQCIANKKEDGSFRYNQGDYIVYIPEDAVVPEAILRAYGYWDEEKNKGLLAGSKGDRVKCIQLRKITSQGIMIPVTVESDGSLSISVPFRSEFGTENMANVHYVTEGQDVAELLGIKKYEPPALPEHMAGDVVNLSGKTIPYDFNNWKSETDIFEEGEQVVASEKLHGTYACISYIPGLNHPEMFFGGDVFVGSKGLSAKGLVFKDKNTKKGRVARLLKTALSGLQLVEKYLEHHIHIAWVVEPWIAILKEKIEKNLYVSANERNLYVRMLRKLLDTGLGDRLKALSDSYGGAPIYVFGEIFGVGVQDLTYGAATPQFRIFDIAHRHFISFDDFKTTAEFLELDMVPFLYEGPFNEETLRKFRDGKTALGGGNIREGIVVKTRNEGRHPVHGRKIAKMISDAYLLRKGENATEFQ